MDEYVSGDANEGVNLQLATEQSTPKAEQHVLIMMSRLRPTTLRSSLYVANTSSAEYPSAQRASQILSGYSRMSSPRHLEKGRLPGSLARNESIPSVTDKGA